MDCSESHSTVRRAQVFSYLGHFIVNLHVNFLYIFDLKFFKKKTSIQAREK